MVPRFILTKYRLDLRQASTILTITATENQKLGFAVVERTGRWRDRFLVLISCEAQHFYFVPGKGVVLQSSLRDDGMDHVLDLMLPMPTYPIPRAGSRHTSEGLLRTSRRHE